MLSKQRILSIVGVFLLIVFLWPVVIHSQEQDSSEYKEEYLMGSVRDISFEEGIINIDGWIIRINEDTVFDGISSLKDIRLWNTVYVVFYRNDDGYDIAKWVSKNPRKN